MDKQIVTLPLADICRVAVVMGNGRSLSRVKADTGADYVCNAGFYCGTEPVGLLKVDGKVLSSEPWRSWGLAWTGGDIRLAVIPCEDDGYLSGVELLDPGLGPGGGLHYGAEISGRRGRTAVGFRGTDLGLYCSRDGTGAAATPEGVRDELAALGCEGAVLLDGGGSSQCDFRGTITESPEGRRVNNWLCVWTSQKEEKPVGKTYQVCLDPGHGVETAGKRSPDGSYRECEFALDMARRMKPILERHGVAVTITRPDEHDISLEQRVRTANGISGLDLFVSLHSNASGDGKGWTAPDGYGVYTSAAGASAGRNIAAGKLLARAKEAGVKLWGSGLFHELWYVCKNTTAPAVLIEHGFHTNEAETALLKSGDYRDKLAVADCKGILDYLGAAWVEEKVAEPVEDINSKPVADWASEAWAKVTVAGIMDGDRPWAPVTRQELALVIDRLTKI